MTKRMGIIIIGMAIIIIILIKLRENECNCKTKIKCPMNGLCNLENVIYQGIIFPKENINNRKTYMNFINEMEIKI